MERGYVTEVNNAPWPPDQDEIDKHDREADRKRDEQGLPYPGRRFRR